MFCKVQLVGRVGRELELKVGSGNRPFGTLAVATNHTYKNNDGNKVEETTWHRVLLNGRMAENTAKYCGKGSIVAVSGRIRTRKYTNREQQEVAVTEIVADDIAFVDLKAVGGVSDDSAAASTAAPANSTAAKPSAEHAPTTVTPPVNQPQSIPEDDDGDSWAGMPF